MTTSDAVTIIYVLIALVLLANITGLIYVWVTTSEDEDDEIIYSVDNLGRHRLIHNIGCGTAKEYPI